MKKIYFTVIIIMTGLFTTEKMFSADNTATNTIQATASVTSPVTVAVGTALDFKTIMPGVVKTIGFSNNVTAGGFVTGETSGHFTIGKGAKTSVQLSLTAPNTLTGAEGTTPIPITYTYQLSGQGAVAPITETTFNVANSDPTTAYWTATGFSFDLGGTVTPAATQTAGTYSATITLVATYN